jgi:hypothetical protein
MSPLTPRKAPDLEQGWDQLEVTAEFLDDLATRVATDQEKRYCLDAARDFHDAARQHKQRSASTQQ